MSSLIHQLLLVIGYIPMSVVEEEAEQSKHVVSEDDSSKAEPVEAASQEQEGGVSNVMGKPPSISLPKMSQSSELTLKIQLHSPSSQIVGTPFQVNNASPFEYPFPSQSSARSPSSSSTTSSDSIQSTNNASSSTSTSPILPASSLKLPPVSSFPYTHPKLRQVSPPPVPPTLAKKRQRWSMTMASLMRRNSQTATLTTPDEATSSASSNTTVTDVDNDEGSEVDGSNSDLRTSIDRAEVPPSDPPGTVIQ